MELDVKAKFRRFCFLGALKPVYIHRQGIVDVTMYWPELEQICKDLDDVNALQILRQILNDPALRRRDEPLFAYAAYLAVDTSNKWTKSLREAFTELVQDDKDLFLFCKYASLIQKERKRKGFSKTVRKAITSWYKHQSIDSIQKMWIMHRGAHGFSHRTLIKLCHVNDEMIGGSNIATPFFKTCTEILRETPLLAVVSSDDLEGTKMSDKNESLTETCPNILASISKLRTTKNKREALRIIQQLKLCYTQVPQEYLGYAPIMEVIVPTMSYLQLLKCWRTFTRFNHFNNSRIMKLCQTIFNSKNILHKSDIHPIVFLLQLRLFCTYDYYSKVKLKPKKIEVMKIFYLEELYKRSFGFNKATGLRMHITINLQSFYKKKVLKNHKKLTFYEAAVALAFAYFKNEPQVDVFYWTDEKMKLGKILWTKEMDILSAIKTCDSIQNYKNSQRLITPLLQALTSEEVYDLFLVIVPSAGRSNPKQSSEFLCKFVDKYRETKCSKARFIIIDLLKFKQSMKYSNTRLENVLEICGLDEGTTNLITNFGLYHFD